MPSFAQPWALLAAAGAAAVIAALHLIARRRPEATLFPTARFVPERSVRAPSRSTRPTDIVLMLLRVAAVLLIGAAFARPILELARRPLARVVVLDLSASGRSTSAARDSAGGYLRAGDLLVVFDSAARLVGGDARDSLSALEAASVPGSLSAGLAAATRAAAALRDRADSVDLVLVGPFATEEWDGATDSIRALWPGRALLVRTELAIDSGATDSAAIDSAARGAAVGGRASVSVREGDGTGDDPVRAVVALMHAGATSTSVRIVRATPSAADSAWAGGAGHVLVLWPRDAPEGWPTARVADTVGAVAAGSNVLVADFERTFAPPPAAGARVVARWLDGAPAATESDVRDGCVRNVAVPFPERGDLALRESARRFVAALAVPCGGARDLTPIGEARLALLRGDGRGESARALTRGDARESRAVPWLLGAALLLLLLELFLRRTDAGREMEVAS